MAPKRSTTSNSTGKAKSTARNQHKSSEKPDTNLPAVSKQTAGGIVGAAIGAIVAGPVGSLVGGVAGAMVGSASAEGKHPIETAVTNVRAVAEKPLKTIVEKVSNSISGKGAKKKSPAGRKKAVKKAAKKKA